MTYRQATEKLRRLGCEEVRRRGSHRRWINPATGGRTTRPDWGARDLKLGTLRAAVRELGLDWQAFEEASHDAGARQHLEREYEPKVDQRGKAGRVER